MSTSKENSSAAITDGNGTISRYVIWNHSKEQKIDQAARMLILSELEESGIEDVYDLHGLEVGRSSFDSHELTTLLGESGLGMVCEARYIPNRSDVHLSVFRDPRKLGVDSLNLSARPANCLRDANIFTIGDLVQCSPAGLLKMSALGKKSLAEIVARLSALGLSLRGGAPETLPMRGPLSPNQFNINLLLRVRSVNLPETLVRSLEAAGIVHMDDFVEKSPEWLQAAGMEYSDWIQDLQDLFLKRALRLNMRVPLWLKKHREELRSAFKIELESATRRMSTATIDMVVDMKSSVSPTRLEEELEAFFVPRASEKKRALVRRRLGWSGSSPATLEQLGQEYGLTRERIRQIEKNSLRDPTAIKALNNSCLRSSLDLLAAVEPCPAEVAEESLRNANLIGADFRIEGLLKAAEVADIPSSLEVLVLNDHRLLLSESSVRSIDQWTQQLRKQVSHCGVARKSLIRMALSGSVSDSLVELACLSLRDLRWLDSEHEWMWIPTTRNAILHRLAKILSVAPSLRVSDALSAVFRDRRMGIEPCPEAVFLRLCAEIRWVLVFNGYLVAGEGVPEQAPDSSEQALVEIFRSHKPIVSRQVLWDEAVRRNISESNFNVLLSNSNVIVRTGLQTYALIGSAPVEESVTKSSEYVQQEVLTLPLSESVDILQGCEPSSSDFPHQVLQRIFEGTTTLRANGFWSIAEIGLTLSDRRTLLSWGAEGTADFHALSATRISLEQTAFSGMDAVAVTFLAFCSEVARTCAAEGEMWPYVYERLGAVLRTKLFAAPGTPKQRLREASESICRKLRIRNVFGREGEQSWLRTVFVQFGLTRSGYKRLPFWLGESAFPPVAVQDLLNVNGPLYSSTFVELWRVLQRFRWGSLEESEAEAALSEITWVTVEDRKAILEAAISRRDVESTSSLVPIDSSFEPPERILSDPRLRWTGAEPVFELRLESIPPAWLSEQRYVLTVGSKRIPIVRNDDTWALESPDGNLTIEPLLPLLTVDVLHKGASVLTEPLVVQFAPDESPFIVYDLATGRQIDPWEPRLRYSPVALLCRSNLTVRPEARQFFKAFKEEWTFWAFRQGMPSDLEILEGDIVLFRPAAAAEANLADNEAELVAKGLGGWWGDNLSISVAATADVEPLRVIISSQRIELSSSQPLLYRGRLRLLPGPDYSSSATSEVLYKGRLERRRTELQLGEISGVALENESGWQALNSAADIDVEYFRGRRLLVRVPARWKGERHASEDWAFLEGDQFLGRPHRGVASFGTVLKGLGEPLLLSVGPYNRPKAERKLVRGLLHSGIVRWIESTEEGWKLDFRIPVELGPDHQVWAWLVDEDAPQLLARDDWRQVENTCYINAPFGNPPMAFAISYRGIWLGGRTCSAGLGIYRDLIESSQNWKTLARWLRWWRVPLLHDYILPAVRKRAEQDPARTLSAWLNDSGLDEPAKYSEMHDYTWLSVVREALWRWRPTPGQAAESLQALGLLQGEPAFDIVNGWEKVEPLLTANPMLLARLATLGVTELYRDASAQERNVLLEMLKYRLLDLDRATTDEFDAALNECRLHGAESMSIDDKFVSDSLLPDARRLFDGGQFEDWNVRVALSNAPIRKFLAVSLIRQMT